MEWLAGVEPTGTKPQERVLHSEAARRVKYKDVFYTSARRGEERSAEFSAGQSVYYVFCFYQLETLQIPTTLKLLPKAEFNRSFCNQKSALSNYFQPFVVYLQKTVDGAVDKRIIRRLLRQNGLRDVLDETE